VEYELHTGYSSEYLFRGVKAGNDLIEAGADVKGKAAGFDLNAGVWYGSFSNSGINVNEEDLYAGAAKDLGYFTASLGYIFRNYDFGTSGAIAGGTEDNQEIAFGVSRDFGCVAASLTYYWTVAGTGGVRGGGTNNGYTELALSHSWALSPCLALNVGTNLGYLVEQGVCTAWTTKVALDWGFAEHAKLSPFIAASVACSESCTSIWQTTNNQLLGGAMLSVNF
ncbi:MAG: hypothetical protein WCJ14_12380, partial [Verrucomicrobiota bacterium]